MKVFNVELSILLSLLLIAATLGLSRCTSQDKKTTIERSTVSSDNADTATPDLSQYGIADHPANVLGGLKIDDQAPEFSMKDQDGNTVNLSDKLKNGPVLIVFLRAEWCSFCVRHLQAFQDKIQDIQDSGKAQVLAISPQLPKYMKEFHEENNFSFPILYDEDHSVMKNYKVFFRVTEKYNNYIEEAKGERIETFNGDTNPYMPVPATYLIDQAGTISYVHYDPNYKVRSDVEEVLAILN